MFLEIRHGRSDKKACLVVPVLLGLLCQSLYGPQVSVPACHAHVSGSNLGCQNRMFTMD